MEKKLCDIAEDGLRSYFKAIRHQKKIQQPHCHNAVFVAADFDIVPDENDFLEGIIEPQERAFLLGFLFRRTHGKGGLDIIAFAPGICDKINLKLLARHFSVLLLSRISTTPTSTEKPR